MLKTDKERLVAELTERLRATQTLIVTDYRGLTVSEIDKLRGELLQHGARFTVVKNTLTRRAAEAAGAESLLALLEGPTAIAFLEAGGDPVAVAKALAAAARDTKVLEIRGGVLDGSPISDEDVKNLATLPPADIVRAQLVGALTAPLATVVGLFTAPLRDFVGVIDARIRQLEEQGSPLPTTETPAGEPAAEAPAAEAPAGEPAVAETTQTQSEAAGQAASEQGEES